MLWHALERCLNKGRMQWLGVLERPVWWQVAAWIHGGSRLCWLWASGDEEERVKSSDIL